MKFYLVGMGERCIAIVCGRKREKIGKLSNDFVETTLARGLKIASSWGKVHFEMDWCNQNYTFQFHFELQNG